MADETAFQSIASLYGMGQPSTLEPQGAFTTGDVLSGMPQRLPAAAVDMIARKQMAGVPLTPEEATAWAQNEAYKTQISEPRAREVLSPVAELTGIPSIARGVENIGEGVGDGDPWRTAGGVGQVALGAIPGLGLAGRAAGSVGNAASSAFNAIAGSAPRLAGTAIAGAIPLGVAEGREANKKATVAAGNPETSTDPIADLVRGNPALETKYRLLKEAEAKSSADVRGVAKESADRVRAEAAKTAKELRQSIFDDLQEINKGKQAEMPFRERYPGAAEAIYKGALAGATALPFANMVKGRMGDALTAWGAGRLANKAEKAYQKGDDVAFTEAQKALADRQALIAGNQSLPHQAKEYGKNAAASAFMAFEGSGLPEQIDALSFSPGHPTREKARGELLNPDYYTSRVPGAVLTGVGSALLGTEAGRLVTPTARMPDKATSVINRGSTESLDALTRIRKFREAEAAQKAAIDRSAAEQAAARAERDTAQGAAASAGAASQRQPRPDAGGGTGDTTGLQAPAASSAPPAQSQTQPSSRPAAQLRGPSYSDPVIDPLDYLNTKSVTEGKRVFEPGKRPTPASGKTARQLFDDPKVRELLSAVGEQSKSERVRFSGGRVAAAYKDAFPGETITESQARTLINLEKAAKAAEEATAARRLTGRGAKKALESGE